MWFRLVGATPPNEHGRACGERPSYDEATTLAAFGEAPEKSCKATSGAAMAHNRASREGWLSGRSFIPTDEAKWAHDPMSGTGVRG